MRRVATEMWVLTPTIRPWLNVGRGAACGEINTSTLTMLSRLRVAGFAIFYYLLFIHPLLLGSFIFSVKSDHRVPSLTHVPGTPPLVQRQPLGWPTDGALLIQISP